MNAPVKSPWVSAYPLLTLGAQRNPYAALELNIMGLVNVMETARIHGIKRVVVPQGEMRAAFAELHIRFRVQLALSPQAPSVFGALSHRRAAFDHDGLQTHLRQNQCRKNTARAKTNHYGS